MPVYSFEQKVNSSEKKSENIHLILVYFDFS